MKSAEKWTFLLGREKETKSSSTRSPEQEPVVEFFLNKYDHLLWIIEGMLIK